MEIGLVAKDGAGVGERGIAKLSAGAGPILGARSGLPSYKGVRPSPRWLAPA